MNNLDYQTLAEQLLINIELNCDLINETTNADIDAQRSGSVITLIFPNKTQIIINLQKPLQEIWLAAKAGGFHYKNHNGRWLDTREQRDFYQDLSKFASEQSNLKLTFTSDIKQQLS